MSRTSTTLRRLGVPGLAAATMVAGIPAFMGVAQADPATTITITPTTQSAGTGSCQIFTVTVRDSSGRVPTTDTQVAVTLTDPSATSTATTNPAESAQFCTVTNGVATPVAATAQSSNGQQRTLQLAAADGTDNDGGANEGTVTFGINNTAAETVQAFAFIDRDNSSNTFNAQTDTASSPVSAVFTPGNSNTTTTASQTATDNVANLVNAEPASTTTVTALATNSAGDEVPGAIISYQYAAGSANGGATATNAGTVQTAGSTRNNGQLTFALNPQTTNAGTDTILVFVNQTSGGSPTRNPSEPAFTITRTTPAQASAATQLSLSPTGQTFRSGDTVVYTVTARDASNNPAQGVTVNFSVSGVGRISGNSTATTGADGTATVLVSTAANETGSQTVSATATNGAFTTANRTATATNSVTVAGTPSPAPTTAPPTTTPPTTTPPTTPATEAPATPTAELTINVEDDTIVPTEQGVITVTGTPNAVIELFAYSRPSTTYREVRQGQLGEDGRIVFRILPGTNTRLFAQYEGQSQNAVLSSESVVQNVATALSLSVVRNGSLDYTFQGRILPRRAGQLITLYRVEDDGDEIITSQVRTDNTGTWRIRRVFTGQGVFPFLARTGQNLTNVAGESNVRPTAIYAGPQR